MSLLKSTDKNLINNWYIACLDKELKNKPIQRVIYDTPLVLYKDSNGKAHAFHDRCAHRFTPLSGGRIEGDSIRCPYHGWLFDNKGKVKEIPSEGTSPCQKKISLKKIPVIEQDNCIWVWMGKENECNSKKPFRFPLKNTNPKESWENYFMITDFDNEVSNLAENFMDVPHTVFVHDKWFRSRSQKKVPITVDVENGKVLVTYDQKEDSIGFTKFLINPYGEPMTHTDCFILPNVTKVDYLFGEKTGFTIISQITPVSHLKCRVYTSIIYKIKYIPKLIKPFLKYYTREVITQDVKIMAQQGASLRHDYSNDARATDADIVHACIENLRTKEANNQSEAFTLKQNHSKTIWI